MKPASSHTPPKVFTMVNTRESPLTDSSLRHFPLSQSLEDIEEDAPMCLPLSQSAFPPPETPQEPMEFLSRSWSISAWEVAKAVTACSDARRGSTAEEGGKQHQATMEGYSAAITAPFTFASAMTAQIVMERIMAQQADLLPASRRKSHSSDSANVIGNCPGSPPVQGDEVTFCRRFSGVRISLRDISMRRWLKDIKERKKEVNRALNAQVHAAMSVAGVAAALAAIAAATATSATDAGQNKMSTAVASAATLVAAQCVEVAEGMGADRDHLSSVVSSAVSVKTPGDVITLTAAAATALRGAATLNARTLKDAQSGSTVIPCERGSNTTLDFTRESASEDSEAEYCNPDFLRKGREFLKRTRKGELHWRIVCVYLNKDSQVVVKSQSKYMGGAITKNKKRLVLDVDSNIPSWPGRDTRGGGERRWYFGIKTDHGVMELECKNETDHQLWTEGISRLLCLSQHQKADFT